MLSLLTTSGGNPCDRVSVGDCTIEVDLILSGHPYHLDGCHLLCKLDDDCSFWRHSEAQQGTNEECLFLKTDYHQV